MARRDDPRLGPRAGDDGRRRVGAAAGVAVILVAVATAVVFALPAGGDDGRRVREAVTAHDRGAQEPAPAVPPDIGPPGRAFSDHARRAGWLPVGARSDRIDGDEALTVFWDRGGRRVAQTVVPGGPAEPPEGARRTGRRGTLLHSFEQGPRLAVTWTREGATAVISSVGIPRAELYDLAGGPPRRRG